MLALSGTRGLDLETHHGVSRGSMIHHLPICVVVLGAGGSIEHRCGSKGSMELQEFLVGYSRLQRAYGQLVC